MKALVFYGVNDLRLEDILVPSIGNREALLKVHSAAICATDLRVKVNGHRSIPEGGKRILGHEDENISRCIGSSKVPGPSMVK